MMDLFLEGVHGEKPIDFLIGLTLLILAWTGSVRQMMVVRHTMQNEVSLELLQTMKHPSITNPRVGFHFFHLPIRLWTTEKQVP